VGIGSKEPSSSPPIDHQVRDLHWPPSMGSSHWPPSKGSSLTTKHGILHWPPSMGSSHWPPSKGSSLTTKHGILHWPPSMGSSFDHQAWDPSLTTKQGIFFDHQAWDPPSSLLLLFKRRLGWLGGSLFALENFLEYLFHKLFEGNGDET
jgi:hypothetical protein